MHEAAGDGDGPARQPGQAAIVASLGGDAAYVHTSQRCRQTSWATDALEWRNGNPLRKPVGVRQPSQLGLAGGVHALGNEGFPG